MRKVFSSMLFLVSLIAGCAGKNDKPVLEQTVEKNQQLLAETSKRLEGLENSVTALSTQVAQLNNRVYEVRTQSGKKTAMTVVPILPQATLGASPGQQANPQGKAQASSVAGRTESIPTGSNQAFMASQLGPAPTQAQETAKVAAVPAKPMSRAEMLLAQARKNASQRAEASGRSARNNAPVTSQAVQANEPVGRMIDPAAAPTPIPALPARNAQKAEASARIQPGSSSAGASGTIGQTAQNAEKKSAPSEAARNDLAMPPVDLPAVNSKTGVVEPPIPTLPVPGQNKAGGMDQAPIAAPAESVAAASRGLATPQAGNSVSPAPRSARGEETAYKAALNATLAGRTSEGLRLFREFIQHYPSGKYAANAEYWIGECLYAQGQLKDALGQFQKVNSIYPRHHKNADALLKAGMTSSRLGDKASASERYRELQSNFPDSDAARRARGMGLIR